MILRTFLLLTSLTLIHTSTEESANQTAQAPPPSPTQNHPPPDNPAEQSPTESDDNNDTSEYVLEEGMFKLELRMPAVTTQQHDEYLVAPVRVDHDDAYIVGYVPQASATKVHHILIYGCTVPARNVSYWNVGDMGGICDYSGAVNTILWAWALDAPKFDLPEQVGFHVGRNANIDYILLQVHYKNVLTEADSSGVDVILTTTRPPKLAGIYLFATGGTVIPPHMTVNADVTCKYSDVELTPFAYRTHTHKLGVQVSAWREREGTWTLLGTGDPQKPQMFYLMKGEPHPIRKGDKLHARCVFVSERNTTTRIGATGEDEMCNFYMMYHMNATQFSLEDGCYYESRFKVPEYARVKLADKLNFKLDTEWTPDISDMGQIGGLSHSADMSQLVVFHRAENDWSKKQWFDNDNVVVDKTAFLESDVIVFVDPVSGNVTRAVGRNHFIMPHGVFIDHHDNIWVTDVALHQVMKFEGNETEPSLVLGTKFEPGTDQSHFCKPSSVVVDAAGFIYIGDGYCNSRVVKFNRNGKFVGEYGTAGFTRGEPGVLGLVHDLTINHADRVIYVADREAGQIHVMNLDGEFTVVHVVPGPVYALEYIPEQRLIAAVNISDNSNPAKVMFIHPDSGEIVSTFPSSSSSSSSLKMPHTLTYINKIGIFLGEIASPFTVWKLSQILSETKREDETLLNVFTSNIPMSFLIVIAVLAVIPVVYMSVVVTMRCKEKKDKDSFDRNGFQKLLRDYDSSDEEEDLVFKNSKVYR